MHIISHPQSSLLLQALQQQQTTLNQNPKPLNPKPINAVTIQRPKDYDICSIILTETGKHTTTTQLNIKNALEGRWGGERVLVMNTLNLCV
jgi:hypothetical protein